MEENRGRVGHDGTVDNWGIRREHFEEREDKKRTTRGVVSQKMVVDR